MSNVLIDKNKIDILANAISAKSGEPVTMTLDEMVSAVDGIDESGIHPTGSIDITHAGLTNVTSYATVNVPSADPYIGVDYGFYTENNVKKWRMRGFVGFDEGEPVGWIDSQKTSNNWYTFNAVASGTIITPNESTQTIGKQGYMMQAAATVAAIPSTYVGSGVTTNSSTSLTVSGSTVTAPAGYYSAAATKAVAAGSVTAPSSITGTAASVSTASNSVTFTKTVSVTPNVTNAGYISSGTAGNSSVSLTASITPRNSGSLTASGATVTAPVGYYPSAATKAVSSGTEGTPTATKGTVSNHSISVTPSVTNTAGYISGGTKTGTAVTVSASELVSGSTTLTNNGTYDITNLSTAVVNVSGGSSGGSSVQIVSGGNTGSNTNSISFSVQGEPTSYFIIPMGGTIATGAAPYKTAMVVYDGTSIHGQIITNTNNAQVTYDGSGFSHSYSNGTLTVTSTNSIFQSSSYLIEYSYDGTAANVQTKDVQVGSGATSITFTNLEDEPIYWSCIFKSNFSTSSGYQRVIGVGSHNNNDDVDIVGIEMDSQASITDQHWTTSYNNGSFTITSQGTNAGGYFHQPGYYQLTYVIDTEDGTLQTKTVTPSTVTQNVTADTAQGYTALKKVVVNPIPDSYVLPASSIGSTTYRASTAAQTIAAGSYHTAQATIAAVTQTNLEAGNIKSGTTISISNGQNNLWSVTGTYTGGGGSANFGTVTTTNSSNQAQSINFTLPSGRTPKAFFARLTSQIARSSGSRYYYVFDMRWDGSSSGGVAGNQFYMYNGTLSNVTSGYSYSQNGTTFTLSSTGTRSASPGSFYNGTYELVYVY